MKKIHITSLGCAKNTVDSEVLRGQLKHRSFFITEHPEDAEVIIVNTCGFIEDAKDESIQAILEAIELKNKDKQKKIFVIGCLSQRYRNDLISEIPEIDGFFGTEDYENILNTLKINNYNHQELYKFRDLTTPGHYAYLKISEGCNHQCAFCTIPAIRGPHKSRTTDDILAEAKILAAKGVKELILVSQDTSYYGIDLYGSQSILDLIIKLVKLQLFTWIRPMYWYPKNFPLEYISLINNYDCIVPYLDIPIQHISSKVLKLMHRAESTEFLKKLFADIHSLNPNVVLRTTLIIGHPGETDEDFDQLKEFVNEIRFDRLGAFVYSDEEETSAFSMKNKVDKRIAEKRYDKIMRIQQKISKEKNKILEGLKQNVLIDSYNIDQRYYVGRTYRDAPEIDNDVIIYHEKKDERILGKIVEVEITDSSEYELYGSLVKLTK